MGVIVGSLLPGSVLSSYLETRDWGQLYGFVRLLQLFFSSGHNFNTFIVCKKLGLNFYFFRSQFIIGVAKINL